MFERGTLFSAIIATAIGAPYLLLNGNWAKGPEGGSASAPAHAASEHSGAPVAAPSFQATPVWTRNPPAVTMPGMPGAHAPKLEGPGKIAFEQIFRFDLPPAFVTQNWSRVSATLADLELEGLRVPLVTGTGLDDISGSLTYYFDKNHRLQRISFQGTSGDFRRLVAFVNKFHHLEPEPTLGAGLYLAKWNGTPKSVLRIRNAPVLRADMPLSRYEIDLEINRPDDNYQLSPEMAQSLNFDQNAGRW